MDNYIQYFEKIIPYPIASAFTGVVESKEYFYISTALRPAGITQQSHYFVLSKNMLIKADIGSKKSPFLNHTEIYRRSNGSWRLLKEKSSSTPTLFSIETLREISKQLVIEYFKGNQNNSPFMSKDHIIRYANDLIDEVFRNQYENLATLYLNES